VVFDGYTFTSKKRNIMFKYLTLLLFISYSSLSADFEKFFPHIIAVEGVMFTVTKYDKGGATKYGITYSTFKTWCNRKIVVIFPCDKDGNGQLSTNDLRLTVLQDVKPIYKAQYWNICRADLIVNQEFAELWTDFIINSGNGYKNRNIKAVQRIVGAKVDGKVGEQTIKKINDFDAKLLYKKLYRYRIRYYHSIAYGDQKYNLKGWLNRLTKIKRIHFPHEKTI
jgi:lysozyme family protein